MGLQLFSSSFCVFCSLAYCWTPSMGCSFLPFFYRATFPWPGSPARLAGHRRASADVVTWACDTASHDLILPLWLSWEISKKLFYSQWSWSYHQHHWISLGWKGDVESSAKISKYPKSRILGKLPLDYLGSMSTCVGRRESKACRGQGLAVRWTPGHAIGIILWRMDDPQPLMVRG